MDARVIIKPETLANAGKLTNRQKGELRLQRLRKAASEGLLQKCKTKADVGALIGIADKGAAFSFVAYQVEKGNLIETLSGRNPVTGFPEYEYAFNWEKPKTIKKAKKVVAKPEKEPAKAETPIAEYDDASGITLQIKKNDVIITFERLDVEKATELTKQILKGE